MNRLLSILCVAIMATFSAFGAAITGVVNFGSPVANIQIPDLNSANFIGNPSFTVITPASGDFTGSLGSSGTATNISGNTPIPGFLQFNGYTVDVSSFYGLNVWTLTNLPGGNDFLSLAFTGVIKKAGFDDTLVTGTISTQYTGGYTAETVTSWSGNLSANGQAVPEPGTYALIGAGLAGIAALRRRRES